MKIIVGLALFFSLCGIGNAQTQSSAKEFSDRLGEKSDVLSRINLNVLQMSGGVSIHDGYAGMAAHAATNTYHEEVESILILSAIYSRMIDERDIKTVKISLDISCEYAKKRGESIAEAFNKILPTIQSAALVNEVTKLRDANISILQTLEFCKTN